MARYRYRCKQCNFVGDIQCSMDATKEPQDCPYCFTKGTFVRTYTPTPDHWKNAQGQSIRSPGRQWAGGDSYDPKEFRALNDPNAGRHRRASTTKKTSSSSSCGCGGSHGK